MSIPKKCRNAITVFIAALFLFSINLSAYANNEEPQNGQEDYIEIRDDQSILVSVDSSDVNDIDVEHVRHILKTAKDSDDFSACAVKAEPIFDGSLYNKKSTGNMAIIKIDLNEKGSDNIDNIIETLRKDKKIKSAERDYILTVSSAANSSLIETNDPKYSDQYNMTTSHANMAWAFTHGSSSVKVGIIDTGIDIIHTDLDAHINTALSKGFISNNSTYIDTNGHGTHVAGIIGAETNNSAGVAGICWEVSLVSLKCFTIAGTGHSSSVISAIQYADSVGIKILNCSFGYSYSKLQSQGNFTALYNAINNYSGIVIAACGNDGDNGLKYPAAYNLNNIISVAALDENNALWSGSNYGSTVDLAAPGAEITSTIHFLPSYDTKSGTSMAAPHVTGAVALLYAINPSLSVAQAKAYILNNVDYDSALTGKVVTSGRLNIFSSVRALTGRLMGDVDGNGSVEPGDARLALRFSLGMETFTAVQKVIADINMDGLVEVDDARNINRIAIGLEPN